MEYMNCGVLHILCLKNCRIFMKAMQNVGTANNILNSSLAVASCYGPYVITVTAS